MSYDDLLRAVLDDTVSGVRASVEASLRAFGDELRRRAAAEREDADRNAAEALALARQQAHTQMSALQQAADQRLAEARGDAQREVEQVRRDAQREIEETRRAFDADRAAARAAAASEAAAMRQEADAAIAGVRQQAAAEASALHERNKAELEEARRIAQAEVEDVQRALEERTSASRRELEAVRRDVDETRRLFESSRSAAEDLRRQLDAARTEVEQLRGRLSDERQELALLHGIRAIDEARTLGDVLDRLVQVRRPDRDRVAVFVVKGDRLQRWRAAGFGEGEPADLSLKDGGIVVDVVRLGAPALGAAEQGARPAGFHGGEARAAGAFPITIGGAVVAVLYADTPRGDSTPEGRWPASFEVLTRHASRVLEAITIQRAAGLLPPAGSVSRAAVSG